MLKCAYVYLFLENKNPHLSLESNQINSKNLDILERTSVSSFTQRTIYYIHVDRLFVEVG